LFWDFQLLKLLDDRATDKFIKIFENGTQGALILF
jgi:hypothetical protein